MSNSSAVSSSPNRSSRLVKWINQTASQPGVRVGYRLRGNTLHLLYEGDVSPNQQVVIQDVLASLKSTDISTLLPEGVQVYQIWLYGRKRRASTTEEESFSKKLDWTFRINVDQIEHHDQHVQSSMASVSSSISSSHSDGSDSSSIDTGEEARRERPTPLSTAQSSLDATQLEPIARKLGEILNRLGVTVHVAAKAQSNLKPLHPVVTADGVTSVSFPQLRNTATHRLWISCRAQYSPSPSLIAEPIARQLRSLNLEDFRDAVVTVRVVGEEKPDWILRIDLTPTDVLLREWARWGDVAALSRLINESLRAEHVALATATLKESTLHLACQRQEPAEDEPESALLDWSVDSIKVSVQRLLNELAPQGIHSAVLYGQRPQAEDPEWIEWLALPASQDVERSIDALALAQNGHLEAIAFLMSRLFNPDLDTQVATGGIRIQLLPKDELLHVMCDSPTCPPQELICAKVVQLLRQLDAPGITGVRIYGRRSGRRSPLWSYGTDFVARQRFVPEPEPQFAATDAYVSELITHQDVSPLRPELTPEELHARWTQLHQRVGQSIQRSLLKTQLVTPTPNTPVLALPQTMNRQGVKAAVIWAIVGLLSVVQIDWVMGFAAEAVADAEARQDELTEPPTALVPNLDTGDGFSTDENAAPDSSENTAPVGTEQNDPTLDNDINGDDNPFSTDEFIRSTSDIDDSVDESSDPSVLSISQVEGSAGENSESFSQHELLIEQSPYPSFDSRQLDLKLALYHQRVAEQGVPDVMVIGSSRALRGIDPEVLERSLANLGYADADVFNFGINGATAQVVDLVVQRILIPEQLPQVIIWADGARAFNGGREDLTYKGIAASDGYALLSEGKLSVPIATPDGMIRANPSGSGERTEPSSWTVAFSISLTESYQALDEWLSDRLAYISIAHDQRDRLKGMIQDTLTADLAQNSQSGRASGSNAAHRTASTTGDAGDETNFEGDRILGQIDADGFLPLDVRFDPVSYYEKFSRVAGNYDKDYANFQLAGSQAEALQSILTLSLNHDVPVVFVNLPLTEEYLDPYRMAHEAEFRQFMLEVDLANDLFVFRDLSALWLEQEDYYGYFSDPSHLNRYGAFEVSKRLAQDAMIPWPGSGSRL